MMVEIYSDGEETFVNPTEGFFQGSDWHSTLEEAEAAFDRQMAERGSAALIIECGVMRRWAAEKVEQGTFTLVETLTPEEYMARKR